MRVADALALCVACGVSITEDGGMRGWGWARTSAKTLMDSECVKANARVWMDQMSSQLG